MDLVCHDHSWSSPSSSSPLQILTAPKKATPAAPKLKKRAGRKVLNETRHPVYRGARRKKGDKWVCEERETALRGDDAPLISFPDSVAAARLPRPESSSSHQRAASEAARELCPVSSLAGIMDEEVVNPSSSSSSKYCLSKISGRWSEGFVDEEAVFNMPALLDGMAEGMLLTPFSWTQYEVDDEAIDFSLWVHY